MLTELIEVNLFQFLLVFVRMGSALMTFPGFGGRLVNARARLSLALLISLVVLPAVQSGLPPMPVTVPGLLLLILREAAIGLFFGLLMQVMMGALVFAAQVISMQAGLSNALSFDIIAEQQGAVLSSFLTNLALVLIFALNLHHLMLLAVIDSYTLFLPGQGLPWGDAADMLANMVNTSFRIGLQMAAPVMVAVLVFFAGLGLLSRLMPQMQIFFIALPLQNILGLGLLMMALSAMMLVFFDYFESTLMSFIE
ncbi:flagellar biosynthetic protein FliR [Telmatospirillum sp. J64-1]|uniref:flagellar biosynthetic protein FliR n=1 Tax=Telmatospirillum sp. J64-1 TaxID=2502183 RepID=UPI00115F1A8D|nr:flagellar biosynthetic protein FliR [Telmatospirillum sp. J64-1]